MAQETKPAELRKIQEETVSQIMDHVESLQATGELVLPQTYSPGNALKLAWLHLQTVVDKSKKPALEVCTKASICNALLKMVLQGMSVVKTHGYFMVYGNQLAWQNSYFGNLMVAKRDAEVGEVNAQVIYEGDEYKTRIDEKGVKQLVSHESDLNNINLDKIRGAYAVVTFKDGRTKLEDMTIGQIKQAWKQGFGGGNTDAHKNFTDQMAKKTVISRACKIETNSSDDTELLDGLEVGKLPAMRARDNAIEEGEKKERKVLNIQDAEEIPETKEEKPKEAPKQEPEKNEEKSKEAPKQEPEKNEEKSVNVNDDQAEHPMSQRQPDF